ncbi:MAG: hypothetical protein GTN89_07950 [Acidobacteria bacterium]|nr:hypothetical protein [Acidobacteriota bacterium]NIM63675.1 hypothetical protein [Acidobacteriota bacterium]NIO59278.1 hypothetical protein [Acidobacteriota bacterium]NIQ30290.1 hypothetical protein [Acidobacteriota bacterium]NIQ85233.1 hypothetical protein [Acidobacteriota bacterium]
MNRKTLEYRTLTKRDLDERIGRVVAELFAPESASNDDAGAWAPVPIDPADFVRRMRPYVVYN